LRKKGERKLRRELGGRDTNRPKRTVYTKQPNKGTDILGVGGIKGVTDAGNNEEGDEKKSEVFF